jgi:autotransporter translocation and assembly factor TamB
VTRPSTTWIPVGLAVLCSVLGLVTMFGVLNGPIKSFVEKGLTDALGADVTIESLDGNPFFEFSLSRVEVADSGEVVFACGEVVVNYRPIGLLWGNLVVDSLRFASPRLKWLQRLPSGSRLFNRASLPSVDLKSIIVDRGILTVGEGSLLSAQDVNLEIGFRNINGETSLLVHRLKTVVLAPPVEITNLSGLALTRDDVLVLEGIQISTLGSGVLVSGQVAGLNDPQFSIDVAADSLSLQEVGTVLGFNIPGATAWFSGKLEGSSNDLSFVFDWVVGGAAGDGSIQVKGRDQQSHRLLLQGREVDLGASTGIPLRGRLNVEAEGEGAAWSEASGQMKVSLSDGSLYDVPLDSVVAEIEYRDGTAKAKILLEAAIGAFYGGLLLSNDGILDLNGRLSGMDLSAAGGPETHLSGDISVEHNDGNIGVSLDLDRMVVDGHEGGTLAAHFSQTTTSFELDSLQWDGPQGTFQVTGEGDIWRHDKELFSLSFNGDVDPVFAGGVSGQPPIRFSSKVWSESLAYGATQERFVFSADLGQLWGLDSLFIAASAVGDRVHFDRFEGQGTGVSLVLDGELILKSAYDLRAAYTSVSLEAVPDAVRYGAIGTGIQVTGSALGSWDAPDVTVKVSADHLEFAGGVFDRLEIDSSLPLDGEGGVSIQSAAAYWGGRTLVGFYADVGAIGDEVSFLIGNKEGTDNRVSVWGTATTGSDSLSVRVDSALVQMNDEYVVNRGPIELSHSAESGFAIQRLHLVGPSGEVEAVSAADRAIQLRIHDFDLKPWAFLAGMDGRIQGRVFGNVSVQGGIQDLTTVVDLSVTGAQIDGFLADNLKTTLTHNQDLLTGRIAAQVGTGVVSVEGEVVLVEVSPERKVDLRIVADQARLSVLEALWGGVFKADGELNADISLTGSASALEIDGSLSIGEGRLDVPSLNQGLSKVSMEAEVSSSSLNITRFEGLGDPGYIKVFGGLDINPVNLDHLFENSLFGDMDFQLTATALPALGTKDINAVIDGTVRLTGTIDRPILKGKLSLHKTELRLLSMLQAPPDPESIWSTIPFFENLQCEVELSAKRQLWVRDVAVNVELSGDIDVVRNQNDVATRRSGEHGFRFFGTMQSLRGTYRFQNRNFRIEQGHLTFLGERGVNPEVNIVAWSRIPTFSQNGSGELVHEPIEISVVVSESFTQPRIRLHKREDIVDGLGQVADEQEQALLLSYVLFGRSPDELIAAEQNVLGEQSAGLVMGLATRELQSRIADRLNLDMMQVEMGSASSISRVRVGKYIGDNLFVTYEDQIGQGREFSVEYEFLPRFSVESRAKNHPEDGQQARFHLTWSKDW